MLPHHWNAVKAIYEQGIAAGNATFEVAAPSWEKWDKSHLAGIRLVALVDGVICGWAALSAVSTREVYRGVAEVTLYIHQDFRGQRIGSNLIQEVIILSEQHNIWTLQSGIFPENYPSIHLHERAGFRTIGYRERIAEMNGTWRDTILMERRSMKVGKAATSY